MSTLVPEWRIGDLTLTEYPFAVLFGADHGSPDLSSEVLTSFLTDGDIEFSARAGNRTLTLPVLIESTDLAAAARAEALLVAECDKQQNILTIDPGDGFGEAFEFYVFRGQVTFQRDDEFEQSGYRRFQIVWRSLPWPQATNDVVIEPFTPPATVTTTVVDDGTSAANWTVVNSPSTASESITSSGGSVVASALWATAVSATWTWGATRSGSFSMAGTPYLGVDYRLEIASSGVYVNQRIVVDGVTLTPIASSVLSNGSTRVWLEPGTATCSTIAILADKPPTGPPDSVLRTTSLRIDQIVRSNSYSTVSTTKQLQRTFTVAGSEPTTGSVTLEHPTAALGEVLIYTNADPYLPATRQYRTSGPSTPTPDASAVSGAYDTLGGPVVFTAPYSAHPMGEYLVMARVQASTATTVAMTASLTSGGTAVFSQAVSTQLGTLASWTLVNLGFMHLPVTSGGPATAHTFTVTRSAGTVLLDELYLFNISAGSLTSVDCGAGTPVAGGPSNRLWLDSPSVENGGLGQMLRGHAADRSDATSAYVTASAIGVHQFRPPSVMAFTVTTGADSATIAYRFRPTGHSSVYSGVA